MGSVSVGSATVIKGEINFCLLVNMAVLLICLLLICPINFESYIDTDATFPLPFAVCKKSSKLILTI